MEKVGVERDQSSLQTKVFSPRAVRSCASKPRLSNSLHRSDSATDKGPQWVRFGADTANKMREPRTSEMLNLGADFEHAWVGSVVLSEIVD